MKHLRKIYLWSALFGVVSVGWAATSDDPGLTLDDLDKPEESPKPNKGETPSAATPSVSDSGSDLGELGETPVATQEITPTQQAASAKQTLEKIEFDNKQSYSAIHFNIVGQPNITKSERAQDKQIVLTLEGAKIHPRTKRIIPTNEFNTQISTISPFYDETGAEPTKVVITMKQFMESRLDVDASGATLYIANVPGGLPKAVELSNANNLTPSQQGGSVPQNSTGPTTANPLVDIAKVGKGTPTAAALDNLGKGGDYVGSRITIDVRETDVADVLRLIAEVSGFSIIFADDVSGKITLSLRDVPWDQVLDIVLETFKLSSVRYDNVLRIASVQNLTAQREAEEKLKNIEEKVEPLVFKTFQVSYADPKDLQKNVQEFLTVNRGKANYDVRTNTLIVADTQKVIERVSRLVQTLDVSVPQVQIEAKVVQVKDSFSRTFGFNWSSGQSINGRSVPGNTIQSKFSSVSSNQILSMGGQFAAVGPMAGVTAQLQLGETQGDVRVVSSPRIVTLDRKEAKIVQGKSIPYVVAANTLEFWKQAGTTTTNSESTGIAEVKFVNADLNLTVTPQVTADSGVVMKINLTKDSPLDNGTAVPTIDRKSSQTEVLIKSGETFVLGGVYDNYDAETSQGIPFLRKIPLFGWLFGGNTVERQRSELLIFLTPTILSTTPGHSNGSLPEG